MTRVQMAALGLLTGLLVLVSGVGTVAGQVPTATATEQMLVPAPVSPAPPPGTPIRPKGERSGPAELALVVSGGVSLGIYQSGFLYMLNQLLKRRPDAARFRMATGASAGSANALTAALDSCMEENPFPSRDLGFRTWIDVGFSDLFDPSQVTPSSIFTKAPMVKAMNTVEQVWREGLPTSCDVVVGVVVTRTEAYLVEVHDDFFVPRVEEKFAVRIRGRGPGRPPKIENYTDPNAHVPLPLLALKDGETAEDSRHNIDQLRALIFASAAFPFAFAPKAVSFCMRPPLAPGEPLRPDRLSCSAAEETASFIDGGVFDNNPMRFAAQLGQLGFRKDGGRSYWRDLIATGRRDHQEPALTFIYLDPDTNAYPDLPEAEATRKKGVVALGASQAMNFVTTARSKELYALVQENKQLSRHMALTRSQFPRASAHLGAFIGFFEREFRRFDFYLGMYDAYEQVRSTLPDAAPEFDVSKLTPGARARFEEEWRPFKCMRAWYSPGFEGDRGSCAGDELRDFRILVQVSLDQLYSQCRQLDANLAGDISHHHCGLAMRGESPPQVDGLPAPPEEGRYQQDDEQGFDYFMRLLTEYQFYFRNLGLGPSDAEYGRVRLRRKMLKMVTALADAQPNASDRTLLLTAGRTLVNSIAYEPPKNWGYFSIGTALEVGASLLPVDWNQSWARLNLSAQVAGLISLLTPNDPTITFDFTMGPEIELLFLTSPILQPMIGFRGGYRFGTRDHLGFLDCTAAVSSDDSKNCSQFVLHHYWALSVVERVRVQMVFNFFPQNFGFPETRYDIHLGLGFHFF